MATAATIPRSRPKAVPEIFKPAKQVTPAEIKAILDSDIEQDEHKIQPQAKKLNPLDGCSFTTRAVYTWFAWLQTNGFTLPVRMASLYKDSRRLVAYEYRRPNGESTCGVVAINDGLPKAVITPFETLTRGESRVREFREWNQGLDDILQTLVGKGWKAKQLKAEGGQNGSLF